MKFNVALIYGGEGFEHEISLVGAKNVSDMINRTKYNLIPVLITKSGEWFIEGEKEKTQVFPALIDGVSGLFSKDKVFPVDVAIPLLHGDLGEDGIITGALRAAHIKFVGCGVLAGAVCSDKIVTKLICEALGIPTARWTFSTDTEPSEIMKKAESLFGYPMFIKPSSLGSSIGISRVENAKEFSEGYKKARALSERVLIEEAVPVLCELECAYLSESGVNRFKIGEILSGGQFYDFDKKYVTETKTSAHFSDKEIERAVTDMADRLRLSADLKQISRIDFFLTKDKRILFNEINTFPGMTKTSLYPSLTVEMGLSEGEFINRLIAEALL